MFGLDEADLKVLLIQRELAPFQHAGRCPAASCASTRRSTRPRGASSRKRPASATSTSSSSTRSASSSAIRASASSPSRTTRSRSSRTTASARRPTRWASAGSRSTTCRSSRSITTEIVTRAHERLRGKVRYPPIGFELLPPKFSLTQLQRLYEIILGTDLDKRNFRKKILSMDLLVETDEVEQDVRHRAARLYRFDRRKYDRLAKQGFELSI